MDISTKKKLIWLVQPPYANQEFVIFFPRATVNLTKMVLACFLSSLSKYKGTCGTSRGVTESVCLEDCTDNISSHLNSCHLCWERLTEYELILTKAGIFDLPVSSKLSEMMICPKHRHSLGKHWKRRRPCQYPKHRGGNKAIKTRNVINIKMAKEIKMLHSAIVPIGSGL